jgi:hypothetical protein
MCLPKIFMYATFAKVESGLIFTWNPRNLNMVDIAKY